jgi:hypothetical protein
MGNLTMENEATDEGRTTAKARGKNQQNNLKKSREETKMQAEILEPE